MKRPRIEFILPAIKRSKTHNKTKNTIMSFPKDLMTALYMEALWSGSIERISPSIPALPINSLVSIKERFKIALSQRNRVRVQDFSKLRMHYVLEVMGNSWVDTLSNPTRTAESSMEFKSGKDFDKKFQFDERRDVDELLSLSIFLVYDGKVSVLLPWTTSNYFEENDEDEGHASWRFSYCDYRIPDPYYYYDFWVHVTIRFKKARDCKEHSNGGNFHVICYLGIENITIELENTIFEQYFCYVLSWN